MLEQHKSEDEHGSQREDEHIALHHPVLGEAQTTTDSTGDISGQHHQPINDILVNQFPEYEGGKQFCRHDDDGVVDFIHIPLVEREPIRQLKTLAEDGYGFKARCVVAPYSD